jgi:hypothetical protein
MPGSAVPIPPDYDLGPSLQRQSELNTVNLSHQDRREWLVLIRHVQYAFESYSPQCRCNRGACVGCGVAALAQVGKYNDGEARVMELRQQLGRGAIG